MRVFWAILFYSSLLFFLLLITFLIIIEAYSLEFKDGGSEFLYFKIVWIPITILATLSSLGIGKEKDSFRKTVQTIITVSVAFVLFAWITFSSLLDMCSTSYYEIYQNKNDPSIKIVKSEFGCGAVDSTPPSTGIVKLKEYPFGLIKTSPVDMSQIDKSNWELISKN